MDFRMFPLRDYSEAELMALPADSRLLLADGLQDGLIVYDQPYAMRGIGARRRRVLKNRSSITQPQLTKSLLRVRALRCISHGLSAFSLYPTTDQQYQVNRFLWQAANDYSFQAAAASSLFQRNVFIISMPAGLFDFLTKVTWEQLEQAMLFVLINLATDAHGLQVLQDELAPALSEKLAQFPSPPSLDACDARTFRLLLDLVMDRIVWMGPWIVPTTLCYLSASDMTELLANRCDRPIFSSPEKFELVHTMMWNIYRDWQTYRHILVKLGGRPRVEALELMARTISKGTQTLVDEGIRTLLQIAAEVHSCDDIPFEASGLNTLPPLRTSPKQRSYFSMLPTDVIIGKLLPKLCEAYAADEGIVRTRTNVTASSTGAAVEPPSPVAVPFSMKNWVLEDFNMNQFYHSVEPEDDEEMGQADVIEALPIETEPNPESDGPASQDLEDEALRVGDSPRTQRRRLNEQGSFETVSSEGHSSHGSTAGLISPPTLE